jgi:hypothetical protein
MEHEHNPRIPQPAATPHVHPHDRLVGVDRLTALTLEARVAIEACRVESQPWQYVDRATFEAAYGPIGGPLAYVDTDSMRVA